MIDILCMLQEAPLFFRNEKSPIKADYDNLSQKVARIDVGVSITSDSLGTRRALNSSYHSFHKKYHTQKDPVQYIGFF